MNRYQGIFARVLAAAVVVAGCTAARAAAGAPRPMSAVMARQVDAAGALPQSSLPPTWQYQFLYGGTYWNETFVGHDPRRENATHVKVAIIPLKMEGRHRTYSTLQTLKNGKTILQTVLDSPVFHPVRFDHGFTFRLQYIDWFQKSNLWNIGGSDPAYSVVLDPTVEPEQTLVVPNGQSFVVNYFGAKHALTADIGWFDRHLLRLIKSLQIPSDTLPLFLTTQVYLTGVHNIDDCCIAWYRSKTNAGQPFVYSTYIQNRGAYAQDVAGVSGVLAGWINDPYDSNYTACGGYEAGALLTGEANYGAYPFRTGGVTYYLEDLVLLPYYGDTSGATRNGLDTLQGTQLTVCQDG